MDPFWERYIGEHRTLLLRDADAIVDVAVGDPEIARMRAEPLAVEVVRVDPASPAQRRLHGELRDEMRAGLVEAGLDSLVPLVDSNVWILSMDNRVPPRLRAIATKMLQIGLPEAVFVAPILD
jgi:hypothetical protein